MFVQVLSINYKVRLPLQRTKDILPLGKAWRGDLSWKTPTTSETDPVREVASEQNGDHAHKIIQRRHELRVLLVEKQHACSSDLNKGFSSCMAATVQGTTFCKQDKQINPILVFHYFHGSLSTLRSTSSEFQPSQKLWYICVHVSAALRCSSAPRHMHLGRASSIRKTCKIAAIAPENLKIW